jgi:PAS domain S-box-containing protein
MKQWLRARSIRSRLMFVIGAVVFFAIVTFGGLALVSEQRAARETLAAEQAALAALVANRSGAALVFGDQALAQENLDALVAVPHVQSACLYDSAQQLFAGFSAAGTSTACSTAHAQGAARLKSDSLAVEVPVVLDETVGTLVLLSSLQPLRERLGEQARTWAITGSIGGALALLLAAVLERLISGPIRRVNAVAESVSRGGDTRLRAPVESTDEVGKLADAFNRMLDRLDEQTQRLKLQAEYNEVLFQRSPLPVLVIDPARGHCIDCNDAATTIYGFATREETLATTAADVSTEFQYDGTPSSEAIVPRVEAALAGKPQIYDWRHRRPDGSEFDAEVHLARFGPDEAPLLLASLFDVTERKETAAQLKRLNEALETRVDERTQQLASSNRELSDTISRLQLAQGELVRSERLASLGSLVAGVAHELNTPLGSVLLVATTLGDGLEDLRRQLESGELKRSALQSFLAQQSEAQALIVRNARRAAELIGRFKQVAVDQTSEQRRRFDLGEVVNEVLGTLQPRIRKTPHQVLVDVPEGLQMDSYPGPLGQVITNLVLNAIIHGLQDEAGVVRVIARAVGDTDIELQVSDNGVGIPAENLPRIFDPFFTTKLGEGGSGLGLHIVYSLVQRSLGGQISVDSKVGQGAQFIVRLPLSAPQAEQAD